MRISPRFNPPKNLNQQPTQYTTYFRGTAPIYQLPPASPHHDMI